MSSIFGIPVRVSREEDGFTAGQPLISRGKQERLVFDCPMVKSVYNKGNVIGDCVLLSDSNEVFDPQVLPEVPVSFGTARGIRLVDCNTLAH
jgi:hypothetical protein